MKTYIKTLVFEFYKNKKLNIILIIFSLLLTYTIDSSIIPLLTAKIVNNNNVSDNLILLAIIYTIKQILYTFYDIRYSFLRIKFDKYITDKILTAALLKCDYNYTDIIPSVIFNKINLIRDHTSWIINKMIFNILPSIFSIFIILIKFYFINLNLTCILLLSICFQFYVMITNIEPCIDISYQDLTIKTNNLINIEDKFANIKIITNTLNGIEHEIKQCKNLSNNVLKSSNILANCMVKNRTYNNGITTVYCLFIVYYSYNLYTKKKITYENFITILLTLNQFLNIMGDINYFIPEIINSLSILKHNNEFINSLSLNEISNSQVLNINFNNFILKDISFYYNSNKFIFTKLNKTFEKNKIYLIYGTSGSGKSTLVKLMSNSLKPTSGHIIINNKYLLQNLSKEDIKKNIFIISQNTITLFNTTILNNIFYLVPYTQKMLNKVKYLFSQYNLYKVFDNINTTDDFLNYNVGNLGNLLSGGQKQIIHLLRLIIQDTYSILILDESINAIDNDTKISIMKLLQDFSKDKIIIIVTHDITLKNLADDVMYI